MTRILFLSIVIMGAYYLQGQEQESLNKRLLSQINGYLTKKDINNYSLYNSIHWLIDSGANLDIQDENNKALLRQAPAIANLLFKAAVKKNDLQTASLFIDILNPASYNEALRLAIHFHNREFLNFLLNGPAINNIDINNTSQSNGNTPLIEAIELCCSQEIVRKLLNHNGIDLNKADDGGETPLHAAVYENQVEVIKMLLAAGTHVDIDKPDNDQWTPLILAANHDHADVVHLLLEKGANADAANNKGETALYFAALNQNSSLMKQLIAAGANIDQAYYCAMGMEEFSTAEFIKKFMLQDAAEQEKELLAVTDSMDTSSEVQPQDTAHAGVPEIYLAALAKNKSLMKALVATGANVDQAYSYAMSMGKSKTADFIASQSRFSKY
jgi:ankyrin repeat protein